MKNNIAEEDTMELMVRGPGNIPLLPITRDDLKAIQDVLRCLPPP